MPSSVLLSALFTFAFCTQTHTSSFEFVAILDSSLYAVLPNVTHNVLFTAVMLNRVINDIYHLRRVHSILPDAVLGDTLKNKLLRLSLQPSLQQLKHEQLQGVCPGSSTSVSASSPSSAANTKSVIGGSVHRAVDGFGVKGFAAQSPYAIEPVALCNLLDSLAYFHLGTSAVASEAVQLVQLSAPTMPTAQLCTTLAACCALGAQQDITATALPLLSTALQYYTGAASTPTLSGSNDVASASASTTISTDGSQELLFSKGANVVMLIDALQKAGVQEKEVWHLLAEHCLRYLESFDGRQLCSVVTALCTEGIDDYPDFFVAAERHITSQPSNYFSSDDLQQIVQCYKELHQPVVSLLAVTNATPQHEENLDRSISAAATAAALSGASSGRRIASSSSSSSLYKQTSAATPSASVQHSLDVFESAAISNLAAADAQGVLELLCKCERRRIMTARVMDTIFRRLVELYYPALLSGKHADNTSKTSEPAVPEGHRHTPLELHQLSQCLLTAFEFNDATLFALHEKQDKATSKASPPSPVVTAEGTYVVTILLDALGGELDYWYHPRLLQIVPYAAKLLPASKHPRAFFKSLVAYLRRSNDLSSHESFTVLRALIEALLALRHYGGEATLVEYMPAVTVAVLNTPRSSQLELTAMMAHLPCAAKELVPGVYRQWGSQQRWLRTITEEEVGSALQIMTRSGQRDSQLLHAVVGFLQAQREQLPSQRVVEYLHELARLGVRDLELFTHTAEHLMRRAVESTPSALQGTDRTGNGAGGRYRARTQSCGAGASSNADSLSPSLAAATRHRQWQITTVHDLALLLYAFTFVLRDSIRVTQQIIARLKMCSSSATPRDIALALYSFVKLRVMRNDDVTGQLCERAAATLADFTASELASTWNSLRCLHHPHTKLYHKTLELLSTAIPRNEEVSDASEAGPTWRFTDADYLSLGSALLLTEAAPLNLNHPLVRRRGTSPDEKNSDSSNKDTPADSLSSVSTCTTTKDTLPADFERQYVEVCRRLLPSANGQRLYLMLCTLSRCSAVPNFSRDAWETVLKLVDTRAESLSTGCLGDAVGMAQLEVLAALHQMHDRVAGVDALNGADGVREESSNWLTPYCPPGLWAVLRPRWRELTRSAAVQTRQDLLAVVGDVKRRGSEPQAAEPMKGRAKRKSLNRQRRKP